MRRDRALALRRYRLNAGTRPIEAVGYGLPTSCRPGEVTWF